MFVNPRNSSRNGGNALIFILIAVFLLGGLTVLLSRTGNQTDETGSVEKSKIKATEIVRYYTGINMAIQNLYANGCSQKQISFYTPLEVNASYRTAYAHAFAPTDKSCHVFDAAGTGIRYKPHTALAASDQIFSGAVRVQDYTTAGLVVLLRGIDLPVCVELNKLVGMPMAGGTPPALVSTLPSSGPFAGLYTTASTINVSGQTGLKAGCVLGNGGGMFPAGSYGFYYILSRN